MLWGAGDKNMLGKLIKRQGASKSTTEIGDISKALKNLAEKEVLPLCMLCKQKSIALSEKPNCNMHKINTHIRMHMHILRHAQLHKHPHKYMPMRARTRTRTRAHTHPHAYTRTQAHTLSLNIFILLTWLSF